MNNIPMTPLWTDPCSVSVTEMVISSEKFYNILDLRVEYLGSLQMFSVLTITGLLMQEAFFFVKTLQTKLCYSHSISVYML